LAAVAPTKKFASLNYHHAPTGTYLNTDTAVIMGRDVSLQGTAKQISTAFDTVLVNCRFP